MKYKVGDKVIHFTGICGMITKVFLDTNVYWFVYIKEDGELIRQEIDECEIIEYSKDSKIGFSKDRA
jgi:preprotein translocase subunit YajC